MRRGARALSRFFIEGTHAPGDTVTLDSGDARKIKAVLRLRDGDSVETIDSAGTAFRAVLSFAGDRMQAAVTEVIERASEPGLRIVLAQGVPKGQKMDYVVEKTTELGVAAIVPYFSARSLGEAVGDAKLGRWRRLARAAAQQSGRQVVPGVEDPIAWDVLVDRFHAFDRILVAWEIAPPAPLRDRLPELLGEAHDILLIVGPEGGLTHDEVEHAMERGAAVISLGGRILRTETAGLVGCTALLMAAGEL